VLDAELAAMLALDDVQQGSDVTGLSPAVARRRMAEAFAIVDAAAPAGVSAEERTAGPLPLRVYTPAGLVSPSPGLVYFHGGGYVTGDRDTHDGLCRRLALGARARVVSVDYRLAPEHRFPAQLEDGADALAWVFSHAEPLGIDPARVGVAGDSAGGNLAAVLALRAAAQGPKLALQALLYPPTDATRASPSHAALGGRYLLTGPVIDWYYAHWLGDARDELLGHPEVSPLFAESLAGAAPALVYTAGFDPLCDEGEAYAERLREAGVRVRLRSYPTLVHGFALMTGAVGAARRAVEEIAAEIGAELRRSA
jgi:acetyl esterase